MCSGVSKSGSPAPKPHTSWPLAIMDFALLSMDRVREGVSGGALGKFHGNKRSLKRVLGE